MLVDRTICPKLKNLKPHQPDKLTFHLKTTKRTHIFTSGPDRIKKKGRIIFVAAFKTQGTILKKDYHSMVSIAR